MLKLNYRVVVLLAAVLVQSGCIALLQRADPAGYEGRGLDYAGVDFGVLSGKTIVIDPGHGGRFTGAVGKKGLTEKEVNLAVAGILRELLTGYGARVVMTREGDTDLLPDSATSALHDDLAARVDSANAYPDADLFLSIHHNNLGLPDSRYNATETYYRMGDYGPSLDLARYLHRQLVRNVGLPKNSIRPGNYYVLRNNRHPAVLGEASYLSHSGAEKKLAGDAARRIEAYAYLLGIVDYLSGGVPVVEGLRVIGGNPVQDPWPQFEARVYDESARAGIDPQQIEVALDGMVLEAGYDPASGMLRGRPALALANGAHRACVRVRNLSGNAAREATLDFAVAVPPAWVRLKSSLSSIPLDGHTPVRFTAVAGDEWGRSVADGTEVLFQFSDPNLEPRAVPVRGGQASLTVTPAANRELIAEASCGDLATRISVPVGEPRRSVLVIRMEDASAETPLGGVRVDVPGAGAFVASPDGYLSLEGVAPGDQELSFEKAGYQPCRLKLSLEGGRSQISYVQMKAVAGGVLIGKKIAVDPAGGLADPGAVGPDGTAEAGVNLRVARFLGDYLTRAGAEVFYTRDEGDSPDVWERAVRAENFGADVLVSISHSGRPAKKGPPPG
ncbi:MAG TPA: N-acetylmuramoyl-L-alanine amidase, partial [Candidatus Glassbacteria bacterium]|nr:N-acetylmuramoyl-L-alanine amidase [Candidatus Glassbacteria bacterium]